MKIAIASDDEKTISSHFGRTRGFVIFEVENANIMGREYRLNTFTGHARSRIGIEPAVDSQVPILDALADCKAVIAHGMGRKIYDYLKQANIEAFITDETDVRKALELYIGGNLEDKPEQGCEH